MSESQPSPQPPANGKAIASIVLGLASIPLSIIIIGIFSGILGIIFGILHLRSSTISRGMAWGGTVLSGIGIVASIALLVVYAQFFQMMMDEFGSYEDNLSQWEGVIAPDFTVTTMDGETIQLSEAKGRRVIIDIWATWCPPCIKEIPHFNVLRKEISEDDLLIVGISDEDRDTLVKFMKKTTIDYPIVADETNLPDPYGAISAYPTTFFIDRNGVIQKIIVGYRDLDTLREYATAPDFEGEVLMEPLLAQSTLIESETMLSPTEAWSLEIPDATAMCTGDWDQDGAQDLLIVDANKQLHIINDKGEETLTLTLPATYDLIEFGVHATQGSRLLGYDNWGDGVTAIDVNGRKLWFYKAGDGINGAHWGDFDGDGTDEMIVGMNGGSGFHGVSAKGKKLWRNSLGNVWNQSIIPAKDDRPAIVLATEAGGDIYIYKGSGKKIRKISPRGLYYSPLMAAEVDNEGTRQILAIGGEEVVACDLKGKVQWSTTVGEDHSSWRNTTFAVGDIEGDGTKEWAFVDANGELVIVTTTGEKKAFLPKGEKLNEFAFLSLPDETSLLITLEPGKITATKFTPSENETENEIS